MARGRDVSSPTRAASRRPEPPAAGSSGGFEEPLGSPDRRHRDAHFIRLGDFADTLRITERLLGDREDLIHKAAGWMLREVGKRDQAVLEDFLGRHCRVMPRTMLRYAIERLPDEKRKAILSGEFLT